MNGRKTAEQLMALLIACACGMAILCFLLPMQTVDFFGSYSWNGFSLIAEDVDDYYPLIIALACSGLGVLFALLANKNRRMLIGNIVLSAIGMTFVFVLFSEEDMFVEAGVGFYLFAVMHLAAIVMAIIALTRPADKSINKVAPIKTGCPRCGKSFDVGQLFCEGCGADLRKKSAPPKEYRCPACDKAIDKDAAFCGYCGASTKTIPAPPAPPTPPAPPISPAPPEPTPYPTAKPKPTSGKRTAICPHRGAKQLEGTTVCKYCGTAMR